MSNKKSRGIEKDGKMIVLIEKGSTPKDALAALKTSLAAATKASGKRPKHVAMDFAEFHED